MLRSIEHFDAEQILLSRLGDVTLAKLNADVYRRDRFGFRAERV